MPRHAAQVCRALLADAAAEVGGGVLLRGSGEGQRAQRAEPSEAAKVPAGHGSVALTPATQKLPAGHGAHAAGKRGVAAGPPAKRQPAEWYPRGHAWQ